MTVLGTALYYPGFHMEPAWGKAALLYWDTLARIVPRGLQATVDKDDTFSRDLASAGALACVDTADYVDETAKRFEDYIVPLFAEDPAGKRDAAYVESVVNSYYKIHPFKLSYALRNDMTDLGVGQDDTGYLRMPRNLGAPYMLCLGTVMKEKLGIPLVTDEPQFERLGEYLAFGTPSPVDADPARRAMFRLGLPMPDARSLYNVPLEAILRFREDRRPERLRLQAAVAGVMTTAAGIDDEHRLDLFWRSKQGEVQASLDDYQRSMRAIGLIDLASLFKVSVPTGVATAVASGGDWVAPAAAVALTTAAFLVDAAGVLGNRLFRKQSAEQKNPWQYAIQVRDTFGP